MGFRSCLHPCALDVRQNLRTLLGALFGIALCALLAGTLLLLADAGNYSALFGLFFPPKPSMLSLGTWAITLDLGLLFALFVYWQGRMNRGSTPLLLAGHFFAILVGFGIMAYTGIFLSSMRAVPFWHTPLIPVLFVLSSLSCALVLLAVCANVTGVESERKRFMIGATKWDVFAVGLEFVCALALVAFAYFAPQEGSFAVIEHSVQGILWGNYAWLWWGVFFGLGLLATLVLDIVLLWRERKTPGPMRSMLAPTFCVLCGALAMRYCIVMAGMHPVLSF